MLSSFSDKSSLSDGVSVAENGLVCQEAECHNIWRLSDKLSLVGIREPPVGRG